MRHSFAGIGIDMAKVHEQAYTRMVDKRFTDTTIVHEHPFYEDNENWQKCKGVKHTVYNHRTGAVTVMDGSEVVSVGSENGSRTR